MANRNRTIYQSQALYVGPTPATGQHYSSGNSGINQIAQLHRVQSCNYSFNVTRQDVNQFGQLGAISREIIEAPTVSLELSYLSTNALNESRLGFTVDGTVSAISGLIANTAGSDKNYFLEITPEGEDAVAYAGGNNNRKVISFGNGFVTNYSTEAAVGGLPTTTVSIEALNIKMDISGSGAQIPAVNPTDGTKITQYVFQLPQGVSGVAGQVATLRPGDISVDISGTLGLVESDLKVQSVNISVPLARENIDKLGSRFAYAKTITFPINATISIDAIIGDTTTGNLADILCNDNDYSLQVKMRKPVCNGTGPEALIHTFKQAKLDSQNWTSSIGPNKTVSMQFTAPVAGPQATDKGWFLSGTLT